MSNYCSAESVAVLAGLDPFSDTTRPTLTQVNAIIADVTNDLDFALSAIGVTTQPTDTKLLGRLAIACKYGTACQVVISAYGNSTGIDGSQGDKFCDKYGEYLKDIQTNPQLYGAVTGDSSSYVSGLTLDGSWTEEGIKDLYLDENYEV